MNWLQLEQRWFYVELDEFYRFRTLFMDFECVIAEKNAN
jgi:hypothetical protein